MHSENQVEVVSPQLQSTRACAPVAFYVREIPIQGDVILSPMDGYSDMPFRLLCRELGSAMSYTEFVNVDAIGQYLRHDKPAGVIQRKLNYALTEHPITFQIYGHDEGGLVEAAKRLVELEPDIIDINMGCYVKDIAERGAGSGMLRDPDKIGRLFRRLTREVHIPVTGKIRLGWDENTRNFLTVARVLEENGASLIAVHGRTKAQGYTGSADWDAIAEVKQAVHIPVLGNGDVRTVDDIARIKRHTGCDGVMIGRAAIGNPWIFARMEREQIASEDILSLMRRHLGLSIGFYGERLGLVLFRKHAQRYLYGLPGARAMRVALLTCNSVEEFQRLLAELPIHSDN